MISRYFNLIFMPIVKLCGLTKPIERVIEKPQSSTKDTTMHNALRARILERIALAQSKNKDLMLSRQEAAIFLSIKIGTLAMWKSHKRYDLPYIKVGRHIRYRSSDLVNFLESKVNA